jgi:hypothetical protein
MPSRQPRAWARFVGAAVLLLPYAASAQDGTLFASEEPLVLRLELPLKSVLRSTADPEYQPARLELMSAGGAPLAIDLRVRARGKSRKLACEFPPLLLNFRNDQPAGSPFAGEDRLKLVTHCKPNADHAQYVLLERQVYRALDALTDLSLRTRAVDITYYDSERDREIANRVGFLIEDEDRFAARAGLKTVSVERIDRDAYEPSELAMLDVFQYFIGNTDWSALAGPSGDTCCHNIVPFERSDGLLLPIPYDFDASGIVSAPYAQPDARLPIRSVRDRLYRGRCRELAELEPVFRVFTTQRDAITALFTTDAELPQQAQARARAYVDAFYAVIADPARAERAFGVNCSR